MKLITLNLWGGILSERFPDFFEAYKDVDIFCFQEMYRGAAQKREDEFIKKWDISKDSLNLFEDIQKLLPDHVGYFRPHVEDFYGLAIFVRKDLEVLKEGDVWIYGTGEYAPNGVHSRNLQYLKLYNGEKDFLIANVHGLWMPGVGKKDIPERLEQSRLILEYLVQYQEPTVLVGDFNLEPETKSLKKIEEVYKNLISKYGITNTRTSFYTKECKYADYVFIGEGVVDKNLRVLPEEVSDHAALLLEFE